MERLLLLPYKSIRLGPIDNEEEQQAYKITVGFASLKLLDDREDDSSRFR
jgi:hypothetical protein